MMFKKIFSAITAAAICLTISSCGKPAPEPETASKEHVFREERVKLPYIIEAMFCSDEKVYIIGTLSQSERETRLIIVNLEGETEQNVPLGGGAGSFDIGNIDKVCPDADGGIVTLNRTTEKNSYGEYSSVYYLTRYSQTGEKLSEASLGKAMETLRTDQIMGGIAALDDGTYMIAYGKSILFVDKDGRLISEITDKALPENTISYGFVTAADGRMFASYNSYDFEYGEYVDASFLVELDVPNKKIAEKYQVASPHFISGKDKYDLFVVRESGLAGYDIETGETETIIDWLKSGFDRTAMSEDKVTVLPDGRILCFTYDYTTHGDSGYEYTFNDMVMVLLTEIPPEELPDKKLVKLYALNISNGIRRRIIEFNKNSLEYEVELTSYADYTDGADRMNIDMVSGNIPDVILLGLYYSHDAPVENYISKGLFADIYKFIDNDPEMERGDFLENVLKAYEVDGKLYEIVPGFKLISAAGKTELVGEEQGWTMAEFTEFLNAHPDSRAFSATATKDYALRLLISSCYESFIDLKSGKCSFDSEEFTELLKFCNSFPEDYPEEYYYFPDSIPKLRSGEQLLNILDITDGLELRRNEQVYFGSPVTFKGFPSSKGNGTSMSGEKSFAITAKAANPEGAWQFVRHFLTEEYQDGLIDGNYNSGIPIRISSLEKHLADCKELPYYAGDNGEKFYYDNTVYNGFSMVSIGVNTDEENEKMLSFIKSVNSVYRNDKFVLAIVEEESGAFFAGQKSAEDVAKIIQNRVQNYLDENR